MNKPLFLTLGIFIIVLAMTACSSPPPQITIEGQYANLSPMFFGVGSVFMKINNAGGGDALLSASTSVPSATVELHDVKDGKMVKTERIKIPAGGSVELKPRSLHIMLFNMPKTVKEGSEFTLTLNFERSGRVPVALRFEKPKEIPMHGGR